MRYSADENFAIDMPVPEVTEENPDREDYGRTKPNPLYSIPANAQVEVGFFFGDTPADAIQTGPPPAEFVRDLDQGAAVKMNWNGKTYLTKNFLIPCRDAGGNTTYTMNEFGRYLRAQSSLALGISMINMQNVMPIIYKRRVGVTTQS